MSTDFNPNIPTDKDTVYDAYFSFQKNMQALNNVIGIDHFSGTALQNRGMHKTITLPDPLDADPKPQGNMVVLYTSTQSADPTSNAPVLKFANRNGSWQIPLGVDTGGGSGGGSGGGVSPNPQPTPSYDQDFETSANPNDLAGTGYLTFPNKFTIFWSRGYLGPQMSYSGSYPKEFRRIFIGYVFSNAIRAGNFSFDESETSKEKFLTWSLSRQGYNVRNAYKTQGNTLSFQVLVLGVVV